RVEDLIPKGYGSSVEVVGIFESGGTTGPPKRVVTLADWMDRLMHHQSRAMDSHGYPRGANWLAVGPSGPHIFGELIRQQALRYGGFRFSIDLDPRWVKKLINEGRLDEA